ncbi:MAG: hypothetical protein RSD68_01410 [Oscillospiraceae bacterium]
MTPMEILHKIVDTECSARTIHDEAISLRDGFDGHVDEHIAEIKTEYYSRADKAIAAAELAEKKRADAEIKALDKKLEAELSNAKTRYEVEKKANALKIFKLAVDVDA